jgi:hypothetical protein
VGGGRHVEDGVDLSVAESVAFPRSSCPLPRKRRSPPGTCPLALFCDNPRQDCQNTNRPPTNLLPNHPQIITMDSFGGAVGGDQKTQIMRQVQQEAAMQNARMLVEVALLSRIFSCL